MNPLMLAILLWTTTTVAYDHKGNTKCTKNRADIIFLLDSSDSTMELFAKQKMFVSDVIDSLDLGPDSVHVGLATFSDYFYLEVDLTDSADLLKMYLSKIYPIGGSTRIGRALKSLLEDGFRSSDGRLDVNRIAIVLTDGDSSDNPSNAVEELMSNKVKVFTVSDAGQANKAELRLIASKPHYRYLFNLDSTHLKDSIINTVECKTITDNIKVKDICPLMHNVDVRFFIDTPSYSQSTSRKLINFVVQAVYMLKEAYAEISVGVHYGFMGQQDVAPSFHLLDVVEDIKDFRFYRPQGMLRDFLNSSYHMDLSNRYRQKLFVVFLDESAEPLQELRYMINKAKSQFSNRLAVFIVTLGHSVNTRIAKDMATGSDFYLHIPDIRDMDTTYEDFVDLLCQPGKSFNNKIHSKIFSLPLA